MNSGRIELKLSNYLLMDVNLVQSDKLYAPKCEILDSFGFEPEAKFPIFQDKMPCQLLSYLRLSRIQNSEQLLKVEIIHLHLKQFIYYINLMIKVNFEEDVIISQLNEYEVLQLILSDCQEKLSNYQTTIEEDLKLLQQPDLLLNKQRIAIELLLSEKRILQVN